MRYHPISNINHPLQKWKSVHSQRKQQCDWHIAWIYCVLCAMNMILKFKSLYIYLHLVEGNKSATHTSLHGVLCKQQLGQLRTDKIRYWFWQICQVVNNGMSFCREPALGWGGISNHCLEWLDSRKVIFDGFRNQKSKYIQRYSFALHVKCELL